MSKAGEDGAAVNGSTAQQGNNNNDNKNKSKTLVLGKYESKPTDPKFDHIHAKFLGHEKLIQLHPEAWTFQQEFVKLADQYRDFTYYADDVVVMTFPKSGTTWTQEIVWAMRNNPDVAPDLFHGLPLHIRTPNIEADCQLGNTTLEEKMGILELVQTAYPAVPVKPGEAMNLQFCIDLPRPRTLKYHLPIDLSNPKLLDTAKVVYVIRDPRDVCLSYLHHARLFQYETFTGTQDEFIEAFLNDQVIFGPYWKHVGNAWAHRNHKNLHIMFYEKMKKNPKAELENLAKFLNVKLTPDQIEKISAYTSFPEMQKRNEYSVSSLEEPYILHAEVKNKNGGFFKKGQSGGWRNNLTDSQKLQFDKWIKEKCPDQAIMDNINNP